MPPTARPPSSPTNEEETTFSISITLLAPDCKNSFQHIQSLAARPAIGQIFETLSDTALVGQHESDCHSQRRFWSPAAAARTFGSPIDTRFGPIRIDWADRTVSDHMSSRHGGSSSSASAPSEQLSRSKASKKKRIFHAKQPHVSLPVAKFEQMDSFEGDFDKHAPFSNGPAADKQLASCGEKFEGLSIGATEVAFGIVHLFKDKQEATSGSTSKRNNLDSQISDSDFGCIVAVLAVPSHLTASHFLSFIEPAVQAITQLRMIRDMHPNRCMVLIKFRDAKDAEDFHKMFNGQPFNAMDPQEICQVVYVTSLTVSRQSTLPLTYPTLANSDPWPLRANLLSGGYELPTCPVCLERMDSSVTGLMTISCQHTFHCSCLSKWGESRCPVCRYSQTGQPLSTRHHGAARPSIQSSSRTAPVKEATASEDESDDEEPSACAVCQTQQDLWVCLICASIGCGRYKQGHAHRHFSETGHLYSLELETQRVWDYAGDGYVHRLIQNKADGKLVELPSAGSASATPERSRKLPTSASYASAMSTDGTKHSGPPAEYLARTNRSGIDERDDGHGSLTSHEAGPSAAPDEKIEAIGLEYSYLLTSQLESQRHFYEDKLDSVQAQLTSLTADLSILKGKAMTVDELMAKTTQLEHDHETLRREKEKSDRKAEKAVELARTLERDLHSERSISKGLMDRLEKTKQSEAAFKVEALDLKEQVQDLMFFVQARDKVDHEGGEAQGGDLEIRAKPKKGKGKK